MSTPDRLPDEALDSLLDGTPSEEAAGTPLAAYLATIREDATATTPTPSADLATVLDEGLDPADLVGAATAGADDEVGRGILTWSLRGRTLARALVTKLAALGMLGKAAAAGAAVTVAASSAGAAGVLPEPAQHTFDDAVGREVQEAPADPDEQSGDEETDAEAGTPPQTPADTSTTPPLDADVSDDATGREDGEPGVDGRDVAEDASDGASRAPEGTPGDDAREERPADDDRRDEAADKAGEDARPGDEGASDAPPQDVAPTESPAEKSAEAGAATEQENGERSRDEASEQDDASEPRTSGAPRD